MIRSAWLVLSIAAVALVAHSSPVVADGPCVEVEIGDDKAPTFGCLNRQFQEHVEIVRPPANVPPNGVESPAVRLGGYNQQALRQQYGPNFGKSAVPYRPAQTYVNGLRRAP